MRIFPICLTWGGGALLCFLATVSFLEAFLGTAMAPVGGIALLWSPLLPSPLLHPPLGSAPWPLYEAPLAPLLWTKHWWQLWSPSSRTSSHNTNKPPGLRGPNYSCTSTFTTALWLDKGTGSKPEMQCF